MENCLDYIFLIDLYLSRSIVKFISNLNSFMVLSVQSLPQSLLKFGVWYQNCVTVICLLQFSIYHKCARTHTHTRASSIMSYSYYSYRRFTSDLPSSTWQSSICVYFGNFLSCQIIESKHHIIELTKGKRKRWKNQNPH